MLRPHTVKKKPIHGASPLVSRSLFLLCMTAAPAAAVIRCAGFGLLRILAPTSLRSSRKHTVYAHVSTDQQATAQLASHVARRKSRTSASPTYHLHHVLCFFIGRRQHPQAPPGNPVPCVDARRAVTAGAVPRFGRYLLLPVHRC